MARAKRFRTLEKDMSQRACQGIEQGSGDSGGKYRGEKGDDQKSACVIRACHRKGRHEADKAHICAEDCRGACDHEDRQRLKECSRILRAELMRDDQGEAKCECRVDKEADERGRTTPGQSLHRFINCCISHEPRN